MDERISKTAQALLDIHHAGVQGETGLSISLSTCVG